MSGLDAQQVAQWLPAIATITVGVVTAVVSLGVTWMSHIFAARREAAKVAADRDSARKTLLREKLELLISLLDQHQSSLLRNGLYIGTLGIHTAANLAPPTAPEDSNDFQRADAIATLYFPTLREFITRISQGTLEHSRFISAELAEISADSGAWSQTNRLTVGTRSARALDGIVQARVALAHRARQMIENELAL